MEGAASSRVGGVTTYRPYWAAFSLWAGLLVAPRLRYEPRLEYEKCRDRARCRRVQGCGWWAICVWCVACGVLVRVCVVCVVCVVGCVCVRVWCGAVFLPRIRFNRHRAVRQLEVRERCFERVSSLELRRSYAPELSVWLWLGLGAGGCLSLALYEQLRTAGFLHPTRHGVI